jgi:hypothetical protein
MLEEQPQEDTSSITMARIALAIVFISLAIPLCVWVLTIVNDTIHSTNTPEIVEKIVPAMGISCDVNTPAGRLELPKPFFSSMSYFILYLFLLIPTTIAIALIKGSAALLNPDLKKQLRQFTKSLQKSIAPKQ